jgi:hypothetical protein
LPDATAPKLVSLAERNPPPEFHEFIVTHNSKHKLAVEHMQMPEKAVPALLPHLPGTHTHSVQTFAGVWLKTTAGPG